MGLPTLPKPRSVQVADVPPISQVLAARSGQISLCFGLGLRGLRFNSCRVGSGSSIFSVGEGRGEERKGTEGKREERRGEETRRNAENSGEKPRREAKRGEEMSREGRAGRRGGTKSREEKRSCLQYF